MFYITVLTTLINTNLHFMQKGTLNYTICIMLSIAKLNNYANPFTYEAEILKSR